MMPTFASQIAKLIKAIKADITAVYAALSLKALDAGVVHLTGTETIAGLKTFTANSAPVASTNSGGGGFQYLMTTAGAVYGGKFGITPAGELQFNHNNITSLVMDAAGNATLRVVGAGYRIKEGVNAKQGIAVLAAGTVTVSNTAVTANSRIFLTAQADGGTPGFLRVSARVAGAGFTILSSNALDTSTVAYEIFEPS